MRLSELVGLNLSDIHDNEIIHVTGKGDKERILYLNQACRDALAEYLKVRPVDGVKDKNALFLSNRMQRISPKTVQHVVYTFLENDQMKSAAEANPLHRQKAKKQAQK